MAGLRSISTAGGRAVSDEDPFPVTVTAAAIEALLTAIAGYIDTEVPALAAILGTTAGAAVITDANGTLQQYLRGLAAYSPKANLGSEQVATQICLATVAGSVSLSKAKWPGAYTVALPTVESGGVANLTEAAAVVGGVFAPKRHWGGVIIDIAGAGAADATTVIEIGKLTADACMPQILASVSLKSITTSGTFTANFNPFTGAAVSSTTFRLYDLVTLTSRGNLGQVLTNVGGTEDNTPAQLRLSLGEAPYYYVLVTTLGVAGPVTICITPMP